MDNYSKWTPFNVTLLPLRFLVLLGKSGTFLIDSKGYELWASYFYDSLMEIRVLLFENMTHET